MQVAELKAPIFSKWIKPAALATLANQHSFSDLCLCLKTLELWNQEPPTVYLWTTKALETALKSFHYSGKLIVSTALEPYETYTRPQMERLPSKQGYPNLFYDFTLEKTHLMEWALREEEQKGSDARGILFCDADICWLGPIPSIPSDAHLAVSPHGIRLVDEAKYGIYNAGFLWTNQQSLLTLWRDSIKTSHFFEQAAIEPLVAHCIQGEKGLQKLYRFGVSHNYGWWRMYQSPTTWQERQAQWSIRREKDEHSGLCVDGQPVSSIHTHFHGPASKDPLTQMFNQWILQKLQLLKKEKQVGRLLALLKKPLVN